MLSFFLLGIGIFNCIVEVKSTILKHDSAASSLGVVSSISHKYISNSSPSKIGVLFDITTLDTISAESNKQESIRQPYELAIVLDRSGSMAGDKIEQAKLAILGIVDNMIEGDIIHIIQYDQGVQILVENGENASQNRIKLKVNRIQPGGSTNLFGGLETAYKVLKRSINSRKPNDMISHSRIFLFSDGLLNAGLTNTKIILDTVSRWKNELDLSISSIGIGYDFDRKLMTSIAEAARGDFFFIDSPEAISKVIDIARKDAASLVGKNAILRVKTAQDESTKVNIKFTNLFDRGLMNEQEYIHFNQIDIRDLRAGDSKYVIVELLVEPYDVEKIEETVIDIDIMEWTLEYDDVFTKKKKQITGTVNIELIDVNDERLRSDDNINNNVKVFWKLNEIRVMDKQILDDIENEQYDDAINKRISLIDSIKGFKLSDLFQGFINSIGSGSSSNFVATNKRMMERMEDEVVEEKIEKIRQKRARNQKVSGRMKEEILHDYGSRYRYNTEASYDHEEL